MVVRRLQPLPIEAIVRGYLIGSGWKDYRRTGTVCGIRLPTGLRQADRLPEVIFTPSTKAEAGRTTRTSTSKQRRLSSAGSSPSGCATRASACTARRRSSRRRAASSSPTQVRVRARRRRRAGAHRRGAHSRLVQVLARGPLRARHQPPSFDKQFVRDYLETLDWDKTPRRRPCPGASSSRPRASTVRRSTGSRVRPETQPPVAVASQDVDAA